MARQSWTRELWRITRTDLCMDPSNRLNHPSFSLLHRSYSALPQQQLQERTDAEDEPHPHPQPSLDNSCSTHDISTFKNRKKQRISDWRKSLPSMELFSRLLRHQVPSPPSAPALSHPNVPNPTLAENAQSPQQNQALYWRDIVHLAQQQNHVLTDTFGRRHTYLRVSLTERCNLRCLYCMPEDGVDLTPRSKLLSVSEIEKLVALFASEGVTKIRLTGGEPTLRRDLTDIIKRISSVDGIRDVCLTTNGITLQRKLEEYKHAGLTHLNISLDTLNAHRFQIMTRRGGHERVMAAIDHAIELGFDPVKVNVVVMRGVNDDELLDFVELTRDKPINVRYHLMTCSCVYAFARQRVPVAAVVAVRFIEYMPFDDNIWSSTKLVPYKEMIDTIQEHYQPQNNKTVVNPKKLLEQCNDPSGEVAKNFTIPDHRGTISFITSMTKAFCGDCNRLRLMADGNFKVCLFGNSEVSLRDALREGACDDELRAVISAAVNRKKAAHAGMFELAKMKNRPMVKIGG